MKYILFILSFSTFFALAHYDSAYKSCDACKDFCSELTTYTNKIVCYQDCRYELDKKLKSIKKER